VIGEREGGFSSRDNTGVHLKAIRVSKLIAAPSNDRHCLYHVKAASG
jgi:hypothetical protein